MSDARVGHLRTALVATVALAGMTAMPVRAATTWYVATNGSDLFSPTTCGSKTLPCRSVGKAISLATDGDTIIVGPGLYGDLDGSGTIGDFTGEETPEIGSGCECMIKINKELTILSRDGALVTVLDAAGLTQNVVHILLPLGEGTVFGKLNKGFTIRNGATNGLLTDTSTGTSSVQIAGNVAISNPTGFNVALQGDLTKPTLVDNIALENSDAGFFLHGNYSGMQRNRAVHNGAGFKIGDDAHNVMQNVAVQNTDGFQVVLSGPGIGRPAASSPWPGFTQNAVIANTNAGVNVQAIGGTIPGIWMKNSNLYGNGDPANNCGAAVDASVAGAIASFYDDYWGAAPGAASAIGPNPADTEGPVCATGPDAGSVIWSAGGPLPSSSIPKEVMIAEKPLK